MIIIVQKRRQSRILRVKCLLDGKLPAGRKSFYSGIDSFAVMDESFVGSDGKFAVHHSHSAATQRASSLYVVFYHCKEREDIFMKIPAAPRPWSPRDTRVLVLAGLFVALSIVLTRLVKPIDLPLVKVTFGFIATSFSSILLGPFFSGLIAAVADIAGYFMFPSDAAFFPGFTLSAFLTGVIYGVFLFKKPKTFLRITLAVLCVSLFIDLGLNTLWLSIMYNKAWMVLFVTRLVKTAIMLPVQVIFIHLLWKYTGRQIEGQLKI